MKSRLVACAALLGLVTAGASYAAPAEVSLLALPMVEAGSDRPVLGAEAVAASTWSDGQWAAPPRSRYDALRYRPRRGRGYREPSYGPRPETFSQIHLGFMDVDGVEKPGVLLGFRGGLVADPNIQIGGQIEWRHRGNSDTQVISQQPAPGGTTITVRQDLSRSSSDLVPMMGFIQVSGDASMQAIPYFGAGAGLEVLHLSAQNFQTGEEFDGTFTGFGWQLWGGVGMLLSGRTRLNVEAFYNGSELSRDVDDAFSGQTFRETIDMNGAGARVGLAMGF